MGDDQEIRVPNPFEQYQEPAPHRVPSEQLTSPMFRCDRCFTCVLQDDIPGHVRYHRALVEVLSEQKARIETLETQIGFLERLVVGHSTT